MLKTPPISRKSKNQGMNWLTPKKRLAIYLRDGLACCYCGQSVEDDVRLTLDHLVPYSLGGTNDATNLVTCCALCNSSRGNRSWRSFAAKAAAYRGVPTTQIVVQVVKTVRRVLPLAISAELLARRGSCAEVLKNTSK